jgi:hypothetical protein
VQLRLFGTISAANRWLKKRQDTGQVRFFTRHRIEERKGTGRMEYWFHSADVRFKADNRRHEVYLTELLSLYWLHASELVRGMEVDQRLLTDATFRMGERFQVEIDSGKMSGPQVKARWKKLKEAGCTDTVLVVTLGREKRLKSLRRISHDLKENGYFTTFARLYPSPFAEVWEDCAGERYAVEKPGHKGLQNREGNPAEKNNVRWP